MAHMYSLDGLAVNQKGDHQCQRNYWTTTRRPKAFVRADIPETVPIASTATVSYRMGTEGVSYAIASSLPGHRGCLSLRGTGTLRIQEIGGPMQGSKQLIFLKEARIGGYYINAEVEVTIADLGIGPYEFWGAKGIHSQMGVDEINIISAEYAKDQEKETLPSESAMDFIGSDTVVDELYDKLTEAWERMEREDDDDYDDEVEQDDSNWRFR